MNPQITYEELVGFAVEFADEPEEVITGMLPMANAFADNLVASPPYPSTSKNGAAVTPIFQAKALVLAHFVKLWLVNTEGMVTEDRVGDLSTSYAKFESFTEEWDQTIYGRQYKVLRRIYATGISHVPQAKNAACYSPFAPNGPNFQ